MQPSEKEKAPPSGETFPLTLPSTCRTLSRNRSSFIALATLAGLLILAARILLLLSGFLPAALLLTRLLPGVLVLLAGILVLIGHRDLPFSSRKGQLWNQPLVATKPFPDGVSSPARFVVPTPRFGTSGKTTSVQALETPSSAVAAMGSRC
jgi:hypothetical protein